PFPVVGVEQIALGGADRLKRREAVTSGDVAEGLDRHERDVRAAVPRAEERKRPDLWALGRQRLHQLQVRELPEARQRDDQTPPLNAAVRTTLGADVQQLGLAVERQRRLVAEDFRTGQPDLLAADRV